MLSSLLAHSRLTVAVEKPVLSMGSSRSRKVRSQLLRRNSNGGEMGPLKSRSSTDELLGRCGARRSLERCADRGMSPWVRKMGGIAKLG